jgi:archaellin
MDHYNTKNTVIGCLTAIILVAIIAVAVVWAGKSIVAGNCLRLVRDR